MDVVERLTLEDASEVTLLAAEHVHRYEFAADLCRGMNVVDLCCGSGYGAKILRIGARAVHGVDVDVATIDAAAASVGRETDITFQAADASRFVNSGGADAFEAVVCFEGVEHVPDSEALLGGLERLAARGIVVVASVPNSRFFHERNPYHVFDYDYDTAMALAERLGSGFVVFQHLLEGSLLRLRGWETAEEAPARVIELGRAEAEAANHFIVVANVAEERILASLASRGAPALSPIHSRYQRGLEEANRELRRENQRLARRALGASGSGAATRLRRLQDEIEWLESELSDAKQRLQEAEARAARVEALASPERAVRGRSGI